MGIASALSCVGPRPSLQLYTTTWHLCPPAGSRAPVAGGTVPAWQMGICVSCQGTSTRIQIGLHFWRAGHSLLCSPLMQDQLMKPSICVLPGFLDACNSTYPHYWGGWKDGWGTLAPFSVHIHLHMFWACAPLYREAWDPEIDLLGIFFGFLTNNCTAWLPESGGKLTASQAAPPLLAKSSCWTILFHNTKSATRLIPALPWSNWEQICLLFLYDSLQIF